MPSAVTGGACIGSGCRNKKPQTWLLKQQAFIFSQKLGVQDQGVSRTGFPQGLLLGLQTAVSSLCPHMAFSPGTWTPPVSSSSYDTSPTGLGPTFRPLLTLSTSLRFCLQIPSCWELGLECVNLGAHNSVPNRAGTRSARRQAVGLREISLESTAILEEGLYQLGFRRNWV